MSSNNSNIPKEAHAALESGRKIEAIKLVRASLNCDLKTAKERVEEYLLLHPDLKQRMDAQRTELGKLSWGKIFFVLLVVYLLYRFR